MRTRHSAWTPWASIGYRQPSWASHQEPCWVNPEARDDDEHLYLSQADHSRGIHPKHLRGFDFSLLSFGTSYFSADQVIVDCANGLARSRSIYW
jgi:hypothetical protein